MAHAVDVLEVGVQCDYTNAEGREASHLTTTLCSPTLEEPALAIVRQNVMRKALLDIGPVREATFRLWVKKDTLLLTEEDYE